VVNFVLAKAAETAIPALLANKAPSRLSTKLGSRSTNAAPVALLLGGAYDDAAVAALHIRVKMAGGRNVAWLRVDSSSIGETDPEKYAAEVGRRCKAKVLQLAADEKLNNERRDAKYFV
jgi:hypothetical protein